MKFRPVMNIKSMRRRDGQETESCFISNVELTKCRCDQVSMPMPETPGIYGHSRTRLSRRECSREETLIVILRIRGAAIPSRLDDRRSFLLNAIHLNFDVLEDTATVGC